MVQNFVNFMGWLSIFFVVTLTIYAATLKWVAWDDGVDMPWRHTFWYALDDAFFWVRKMRLIEKPRPLDPTPAAAMPTEDAKKPVKS